ncbi:hypothetical protein Ancab_003263, partial [Ancistrocladus abbreviatus]
MVGASTKVGVVYALHVEEGRSTHSDIVVHQGGGSTSTPIYAHTSTPSSSRLDDKFE